MFGRLFNTISAIGDAVVDILEPSRPKSQSSTAPLTSAKRQRTTARKREIRNAIRQAQTELSAELERGLSQDPSLGNFNLRPTKTGIRIQLEDIDQATQALWAAKFALEGSDKYERTEPPTVINLEFGGTEQKVKEISRRANDEYDIISCLDNDMKYDKARDPFLKELNNYYQSQAH